MEKTLLARKRKITVEESDNDDNDDTVPLESDSESCAESEEVVNELKRGDFAMIRYKLESK